MSQLNLQSMYQDYKKRSLTDNGEFQKMQEPLESEVTQMPLELDLVKSMYNRSVYYDGYTSH